MLKTTLNLAAVALALLLSTAVSAQSLQYKGPHSTDAADSVDGGEGVLAYNALCAATFDGAQMCESIDLLRSGGLPVEGGLPQDKRQWVKPTLIAVFKDGDDVRVVDASGVTSTVPGELSCRGWSSAGATKGGLFISHEGRFQVAQCSVDLAVACCMVNLPDTKGKK